MKVSIITATYNSASTIHKTIGSIAEQDYKDIEFIVVDGNSTDDTLAIIRSHTDTIHKWISEPDTGMYQAINKGIQVSTGDIIGILNSDDFYHRKDAISQIVQTFESTGTESVLADVLIVQRTDETKVHRYYSSGHFRPWKFRFGFMPAHPTFFVKREILEKIGPYKENYKLTSDFEFLIRYLWTNKIKCHYIPIDLLSMRRGGMSSPSLKNIFLKNRENLQGLRENNIYSNYLFISSRYLIKALYMLWYRIKHVIFGKDFNH
ncbi:glycosyltransferase [Cyclobacteriaceae bacterium YHN15]|nr:glycosyltransferase [Cyclobacteriaceae bacterium YHN15]